MIKAIIHIIRPHQWLKNVFVFLPAFFSGTILSKESLMPSLVAFFVFCLAASGVYCFNDIHDIESDRQHSQKRLRPIASGAISKTTGIGIMFLCYILSLTIIGVAPILSISDKLIFLGIILGYILMNIFYSIKLKQIAILDVFIIAVGFVLRLFAGGMMAHIYISHWIILMTFLLALFLAFAKRRDDMIIYENTGIKGRSNINSYNMTFLNQTMTVVASITLVCYILYTVSPEVCKRYHCDYMYITSFFVLAGILRYLQITIVYVRSGSPTKVLLRDRFIQVCIAGWILTFLYILYI